MSDIKTLISQGENLREKEGKHDEAIKIFEEALALAEAENSVGGKANALGQIGLTLWHAKRYDEARAKFEELLAYTQDNNDPSNSAVAYKNLSRPEITHDNLKQIELAAKAYELAKTAGRNDLVWFAHGVFNTAYLAAESWLEIEATEIAKLDSGEVKESNETAKMVWKTCHMMNKGKFERNRELLEEALKIAEENNLTLRVEQIKKVLETVK